MPSANTVQFAVVLAGLIVPVWPIWTIRRRYISIPISALLSCWLLWTLVGFTVELDPGPDGFGAGVMMVFAPFFGVGYAVVLACVVAVLRAVTGWGTASEFGRRETIAGLAIWGALCVLGFAYPFVAPPAARRGDPLLVVDYFFFCGPVLLLAVVMVVVVYVFRWRGLRSAGIAAPQAATGGQTA